MKKIYLFCLLLLSAGIVNAQIETEIKSYSDSSQLIINNGRQLVLHSFMNGDYQKANQVYQYLSAETADAYYSAFSYTEDLYINLLLENLDKWFELTANYSEYGYKRTSREKYPIADQLFYLLQKLDLNIDYNSILYDDEKDLMQLYIYFIKDVAGDDYEKSYKSFKKKYNESVFNPFLKHYLPSPAQKASAAYYVGSGGIFPTSKLKNNFSSNASFTMSIDFNLGRVYTSLHLALSEMRLKEPFSRYNINFYEGDRFSYFDGGLSVGYFLVRSKRFHVAPYASIGGAYMESNLYPGSSDYEISIFSSFIYGPGLHTELKLLNWGENFLSLKADAGYNFVTKFQYDNFSGNTYYFKAGLVFGIGDF